MRDTRATVTKTPMAGWTCVWNLSNDALLGTRHGQFGASDEQFGL